MPCTPLHHADGGYHLMGCMLSAASCNKWWMDEILKTKDYARRAGKELQHSVKIGCSILPYLMGERSPHNNPDARAMFVGMSMDTTREDMTLAVLRRCGIWSAVIRLKWCADHLESESIRSRICGGGAKSPLWKTDYRSSHECEA